MMPEISTTLSVISLLLTIGGLLGGFYAFKEGMARTANEVQERVIHALETEIANLRARLDDLKDENTRLRLILETICVALKSRGLAVTINGDMVSIHDMHGDSTTTHLQQGGGHPCL